MEQGVAEELKGGGSPLVMGSKSAIGIEPPVSHGLGAGTANGWHCGLTRGDDLASRSGAKAAGVAAPWLGVIEVTPTRAEHPPWADSLRAYDNRPQNGS